MWMPDENLEAVRRAFDAAAPIFDARYLNPIAAWTRKRNLAILRETFRVGSRLIELGCGAGEDAVALASEGRSVFGVDLSAAMVDAATRRAARAGLQDRITIVEGRSADLTRLLHEAPWGRFDGAYASFSLFTEDDLHDIARVVGETLPAQTLFVCTIGNRLVLSELVLYGTRLQMGKALVRLRQPRQHNIYGQDVRIREYFPREVMKAFGPYFELKDFTALPAFLPPVYLHAFYSRLGTVRTACEKADTLLAHRFPWRYLGENILYRFRRV